MLFAAGERDHNGLCSFATQCLHNVIFLCNQSLSPAHNGSSSPQAREEAAHRALDTTDKSAEALLKTSGGLANPSGGLPYPSNGHRGRLGSSREGSAAEAAEQLAMLSLDRSRASSGELHISRYIIVHTNIFNHAIYVYGYLYIYICVRFLSVCVYGGGFAQCNTWFCLTCQPTALLISPAISGATPIK